MVKRFISNYFVESVLVLVLIILCMASYVFANSLNLKENENLRYVSEDVLPINTIPVLQEEKTTYVRPYKDQDIKIVRNFYDYTNKDNKEDTIIYYENTYIENQGVDYANGKIFDVLSIADGTVMKVTTDDIVGTTIKIKHEDGTISVYQSLSEATVKENDVVNKGEVIGKSGTCKMSEELKEHLHFELYVNNILVNPEKFFNEQGE